MNCRFPILILCLLGGLFQAGADPSKKNFVFFLVDDLGWADVGCFGSTFHETPQIDALAASGMKFTNGYAAASICSPTRASIMTGRHPVRVNITDWIPGTRTGGKFQKVEDRDNLALEEVTIAEVLKENGYATFFAGKWHLGGKGFWPDDQGFDVNIGGHDRGSPPGGYYAPWNNPALQAKADGEYLTERLTEESVNFIRNQKGKEPFLLYLSYYNVHTPIQPYRKKIEHFRSRATELFAEVVPPIRERDAMSRGRQDNPDFASMVAAVDDSVGAILKMLADQEMDSNTVVIFFSDNGGLCTLPAKRKSAPTCNLPLRSGKGWLYEGGIREPTLVRVPGLTGPGSVCDAPIVSMDFFPTILELAGIEPKPDLHCDGESIVPLLKNPDLSKSKERVLHWHYPHYHGSGWKPGAAVRQGPWKLISFWEYDEVELYRLDEDPGEHHDLSKQHPAKVAELLALMKSWQEEMGARMPVPTR